MVFCSLSVPWSLILQRQPERLILHKQTRSLRAAWELQGGRRLLLWAGWSCGRRFPAAAARWLGHHARRHGSPLQRYKAKCVFVCDTFIIQNVLTWFDILRLVLVVTAPILSKKSWCILLMEHESLGRRMDDVHFACVCREIERGKKILTISHPATRQATASALFIFPALIPTHTHTLLL